MPGLPKTLNTILGAHRFVKSNNAKQWRKLIFFTVRGYQPTKPLEKAQLTFIRHNWRTLDYDSLVACFKPVCDGLVDAKLLKNDTWKITGPWIVDQKYCPRGEEHIEIFVKEIKE